MLEKLLLTLIGSGLEFINVISTQDLRGCTYLLAASLGFALEIQQMSALNARLELADLGLDLR